MDKQCILFPIDDFSISGVTTFVNQYTHFCHTNGLDSIVVGFWGDALNDKEMFRATEVRVIHKLFNRFKFLGFIDWARYLVEISKIIVNNYVSHVHLGTTRSSVLTLFSPYSWQIRKTGTFYGDWALEMNFYQKGFISRAFRFTQRRLLQRFTLSFMDTIIVFSRYAKSLVVSLYGVGKEKIVIIPGAVDRVEPMKRDRRSDVPLHLVNISRIDPRKGHENLLRAIQIVHKIKTVFLTIAGPFRGSNIHHTMLLYERLRLFTSVRFVHGVNNEEKKQLYKTSDLFVMPSVDLETFGMTIIEALAAGVPVIGVGVGAIPEILSRIDSRLVISDSSPQAIAKKILWYMRLTKKQREAIVEKSKNVVLDNYIYKKISPLFYSTVRYER